MSKIDFKITSVFVALVPENTVDGSFFPATNPQLVSFPDFVSTINSINHESMSKLTHSDGKQLEGSWAAGFVQICCGVFFWDPFLPWKFITISTKTSPTQW